MTNILDTKETIFALSTPNGKSAIAVIRISGRSAFSVFDSMAGGVMVEPRKSSVVTLKTIDGSSIIDKPLCLAFGAPHSFTGENTVELFLHGGRAIIASVMDELSKIGDFRLAEPGEFTKRALLNGKVDLITAESIRDIIDADTEVQRKLASRVFSGGISDKYDLWSENLISILAKLEAYIDFPDDDIPSEAIGEALSAISRLCTDMRSDLRVSDGARSIMSGVKLAICGVPNVGKSSLLNVLARQEAAIVSDLAGTTRDVIKVRLDINGFLAIVADTAGIRDDADDEIEIEGIRRARNELLGADISIVVIAPEICINTQVRNMGKINSDNMVVVLNKCDTLSQQEVIIKEEEIRKELGADIVVIKLSCQVGHNISQLLDTLSEMMSEFCDVESDVIINVRQRECIREAVAWLSALDGDMTIDMMAHHVRSAYNSMELLVGRFDIEKVLDEIFSSFCIGK